MHRGICSPLLLEARDPETGEPLDEISVQANIVTFIGAGHETTANALIWSLYLLARAPEWAQAIRTEADAVLGDGPATPQALDKLIHTRAVLEEAMRLYPPVPFMSREAMGPDRIAGIRVPKGTLVTIAPWVLASPQDPLECARSVRSQPLPARTPR